QVDRGQFGRNADRRRNDLETKRRSRSFYLGHFWRLDLRSLGLGGVRLLGRRGLLLGWRRLVLLGLDEADLLGLDPVRLPCACPGSGEDSERNHEDVQYD